MKRTILLLMMVGLCWEAAAQPNLDSLYAVWKDPQRPDSVRSAAYYNYVWDGFLYSKPDTAFLLAEELIAFGEAQNYPVAKVQAYNMQAIVLQMQGSNAKAIVYFQKAITIGEQFGIEEAIAGGLGNIGVIYYNLGNYPKALEHYQKSLTLYQELNNRAGMATALMNVGNIYGDRGDHDKAQEYYERSLAIFMELGDKSGELAVFASLGTVPNAGDQELDYLQQGLAIAEELGDDAAKSNILTSIGTFHEEKGDHARALDFLQRSLTLSADLGDKMHMAETMWNLGEVHLELGDRSLALEHCSRALRLAQEAGVLVIEKGACQCLYDTYKAMGQGNEALRYLEQMRVVEDSLRSEETTKKLEQMEFAQQMFADSVAQAEEARVIEAAHQEEIRKKNRTRNYLALGGLGLFVVAGGLYGRARHMRRSRDIISKERDRSENLLLNILPAEVAEELKEKGEASARDFDNVSILFTDFKGFTQASEKLSAAELVAEINTCFKAFDGIVEKHGIEKIKTIGDAYMAAGGLPVPDVNAARNTVLAGLEMQAFIETRHAERSAQGLPAFEMRVGIHTGPVVAGIVGVKKFQYDIWGDTVNTASRMESSGEIGQVNISEATYALVKNEVGFSFTPRGKVQAKGKGEMEMYFVERSV